MAAHFTEAQHRPGAKWCEGDRLAAQRCQRNALLVAVALFVGLALLAVWQIATLQAALLGPLGVFTLGMNLGAMTGVGFVTPARWGRYVASRS